MTRDSTGLSALRWAIVLPAGCFLLARDGWHRYQAGRLTYA